MGRGIALRALVRLEASAAEFLSAGEAAERLGWVSRASRALHDSGVSSYAGSAFAAARAAWARRLRVCERRADLAGAGATLGNIGAVHAALGDHPTALSFFERALTSQEVAGDDVGAAKTLANVGAMHHKLGDYARALQVY